MSARTKTSEAERLDSVPEEPEINPVDDVLWHLQIEARRLAKLVAEHGLDTAQRRDLQRSLAVLHAAAEPQPARERETEPAL
jgi:hypothetical protein